jgi:hypothetical protein
VAVAATESATAKRKSERVKGAPVTAKSTAAVAVAPSSETIYSARLTLREWLTALENANLLKPGATLRILTNRKLKRVSLPATAG